MAASAATHMASCAVVLMFALRSLTISDACNVCIMSLPTLHTLHLDLRDDACTDPIAMTHACLSTHLCTSALRLVFVFDQDAGCGSYEEDHNPRDQSAPLVQAQAACLPHTASKQGTA